MSITVNPYLFFKGNCREALEFYKNIFGGELTFMTYGDAKAANEENSTDSIMHVDLTGGTVRLMASDTAKASAAAAKVAISLSGTDEASLRRFFEQLSDGITPQYPLKKEFWGDTFGSLTDKYGVEWMVNITAEKAPAA